MKKKILARKKKEARGLARLTIAILQKNERAQQLIDEAKKLLMEAGILRGEINRRMPLSDHVMNM